MSAKRLIVSCTLAFAASATAAAHTYGHLDKSDKPRARAAEAPAPVIPRVVVTATKEQVRAARAAAEPVSAGDNSVKTRKIGRIN
jgi:hypothetical protein